MTQEQIDELYDIGIIDGQEASTLYSEFFDPPLVPSPGDMNVPYFRSVPALSQHLIESGELQRRWDKYRESGRWMLYFPWQESRESVLAFLKGA